jgi:hypothetical protein
MWNFHLLRLVPSGVPFIQRETSLHISRIVTKKNRPLDLNENVKQCSSSVFMQISTSSNANWINYRAGRNSWETRSWCLPRVCLVSHRWKTSQLLLMSSSSETSSLNGLLFIKNSSCRFLMQFWSPPWEDAISFLCPHCFQHEMQIIQVSPVYYLYFLE